MECEIKWIFIRQCHFCLRDERVLKYFLVLDVLGSIRVPQRCGRGCGQQGHGASGRNTSGNAAVELYRDSAGAFCACRSVQMHFTCNCSKF